MANVMRMYMRIYMRVVMRLQWALNRRFGDAFAKRMDMHGAAYHVDVHVVAIAEARIQMLARVASHTDVHAR